MKSLSVFIVCLIAVQAMNNEAFLPRPAFIQMEETETQDVKPASYVGEERHVEKPRSLVHKIIQLLFREDAPQIHKDYDSCVVNNDNTVKEPGREETIIGSRDLVHICRRNSKTIIVHKILTDMLVGLKRYMEGCALLQKHAPIIEEKMMELAKSYRVFTNDALTWFQKLGLFESENADYLNEIAPEWRQQWKKDNDSIVALVPGIKESLHTMRMFTEGHASKLIKNATKMDPEKFVEGLRDMLSDDWIEMADIVSQHVGDICKSA